MCYPDVNYDDIMHGWTENRTMNIGRTNAKNCWLVFVSAKGIRIWQPGYFILLPFPTVTG